MATAAQITSVIELGLNVALAAIPYTAAFAPLAVTFEAGINPLIASLTTGASKTSDVMAGLGATIALINTLKAVPGVPADVLAKLDVYLTAAQDGLTAALAVATKGFDANQLTQLTPIA